jgi:stage V sporulation protein R
MNKSEKFMHGSPVLMGDNTIPGVSLPPEIKKLLPEIYKKVSDFGCDFHPTVVEMLTYDEISEIAAYGGFPVRFPHWRWGMEYEELQRGYVYGMHKIYEMVVNCCSLNTRILTKRGTILAKDVVIGDIVYGRKGPRKVAFIKKQKSSKTLRIKLKDQFRELTCTPNHKWLVLGQNGYSWVETKKIKSGDQICGYDGFEKNLGNPYKINYNKNSCFLSTRANIRHCLKKIKIPNKMTLELAELIGVIIGDGCIVSKGSSRNIITVAVGLDCKYYAKHVSNLFYKCFGEKAKIYKKPNCFCVTFCSKIALDFLDFIGLKKGSNFLNKRIPHSIWQSSFEFKAACIKGLFDTDGHVSSCISYSSKSKQLIDDIQLILSEMGIFSSAKHVNNRSNNIFTLRIKGRPFIRKFAKRIQLISKHKNSSLIKISNRKYCSSNGQKLNYFQKELTINSPEISSKENHNMYYSCKRIKNNKNLSLNTLYSFCERIDYLNIKEIKNIKNQLEIPHYEVEDIIDDCNQETIDIALLHDDHDYAAEGLMSHNTNPVYLYCLDSNTLVDNVTVVAHALGHADFFKNNIYFSQTSQNMMNQLANHGTRIREYMSRWGKERVTEFIDHVLRIETLIDFSKSWERKKIKNPIIKDERIYRHPSRLKSKEDHDYMDDYLNPQDWINKQQEKIQKIEAAEYLDIFNNPTKDIMRFIRDYAPLKPWEADIVAMLYDESMYFAPQRLTKTINEGWACAARNTRIPTDAGILTIGEIVDKKMSVNVFDGENIRPITNWFVFPNRDVYKIITRRGYVFEGSNTHRILNIDDWIRLDQLKINHKVKISYSDIWNDKVQKLDYEPSGSRIELSEVCAQANITRNQLFYRKYQYKGEKKNDLLDSLLESYDNQMTTTMRNKRKKIKIPEYMEENFASFLGYMIGDGHISVKKRTIGLTTGDKEQADNYISLVSKLFGLDCKIKWDDSSKNGRYRIRFSSKELECLLIYIGMKTGVCARLKNVPEILLKSPKKIVASFIRSYFDCDGYAGSAGVILSTASQEMSIQIQNILLNFNIISIRRKQKDSCWQVSITGSEAVKFRDQIGFGLTRKKNKLDQYINKHKWFVDQKLEDEIVSIEKTGVETVFDITVEESHKYCAHGFINHNSYVDYNIMAKQGFSALGQSHESSGIIEYSHHKMGVLGGKYSMNPYKLGFCLFLDIEERWNKGQFGAEWEDCEDIREKENWDKKLNLGHDKVFEIRKFYNDLTFIMEFFTPEFCENYQFFEWKKYPNGEYKIESRDHKKIKKKLIQRYTNGGLPEIYLTDCNHKGKGILFLEHKSDGRPLYDPYIRPVIQSLRYLWKNDVCLSTKTVDGTELIYRCLGEDVIDVVERDQYLGIGSPNYDSY